MLSSKLKRKGNKEKPKSSAKLAHSSKEIDKTPVLKSEKKSSNVGKLIKLPSNPSGNLKTRKMTENEWAPVQTESAYKFQNESKSEADTSKFKPNKDKNAGKWVTNFNLKWGLGNQRYSSINTEIGRD